MNNYTTYAFYNEKGNRLAIFCEHTEDKLEIAVFECSKKDSFSKKKAKEAYKGLKEEGTPVSSDFSKIKSIGSAKYVIEKYNVHNPKGYLVDVVDNKPKKTFIGWCKEHYLRPSFRVVKIVETVIATPSKSVVLSRRVSVPKLSENI